MSIIFRVVLVCCSVIALMTGECARAQYAGHVSSFVMNANTGKVLSQVDADLQRYPASLTKMMTLYLAFQALDSGKITLNQKMPVSIHASKQEPSKLGLRPGTYLTVRQAILALVTKSANDAACTLGEFLGAGSETRFAVYMTSQARRMKMHNTTFQNASGLPDPDQVTTAHDLAQLAQHLIDDYPQYYNYFSTDKFIFRRHVIVNHDPLLKLYAGADGLKTGYTSLAGHNLASSVKQGHVRLIGVVLGAESNKQRNDTMIAMFDRGFVEEGQAPLPLLEQRRVVRKRAVRRRAGAHRKALRRRVVFVSYHTRKEHKRVVHHIGASRRGYHRS